MSQKWNLGRWGTFRWSPWPSDVIDLLDQKVGVYTRRRIIWKLDSGNQDITEYFLSGASVSQEKERAPDRLTAGDAQLRFSNKDDTFTENLSTSILYEQNYHNRVITFEIGIERPSGAFSWMTVATMKVVSLELSSTPSEVNIRVQDMVERLLRETINARPSTMDAVAGGSNAGDGIVSEVDVRPFVNVAQNWTLTCTLGGNDGVATFSVVGSVSGNIGTATSGTEFSDATGGGIKFTIQAGNTNWAVGDVFTFSTVRLMEYTAENPVKVIWSLLTGYDYDTDVAEAWLTRTPQLDHTQSSSNTDLNWAMFEKAVDDAASTIPTIKGFIPWNSKLVGAIEGILLHFLGAMFVDPQGKLTIKLWRPEMWQDVKEFADSKKARRISYVRDVRDVINRVKVKYRKLNIWPWANEESEDELDGIYVAQNDASYTTLQQWYDQNFVSYWWNSDGDHVAYFALRLVDKYGETPRKFNIKTGIDALEVEIGDIVAITDTKLVLDRYEVEVMRKDGDYDSNPVAVSLIAEDTGTYGIQWGFLGSSADEGDGLSPQAADYASATDANKLFCYLSATGATAQPLYYMFGLPLAILVVRAATGGMI